MSNEEKIKWLEAELRYCIEKIELSKESVKEFYFREDMARREIDRLSDLINKEDTLK